MIRKYIFKKQLMYDKSNYTNIYLYKMKVEDLKKLKKFEESPIESISKVANADMLMKEQKRTKRMQVNGLCNLVPEEIYL